MEALVAGKTLFIQRSSSATKMRCVVLGCKAPHYVILELPLTGGATTQFMIDDRCVARLFYKGDIFAFHSSVVRVFAEPFPMMIISYPHEHQQVAVRQHQRLACHVPSRVSPGPPQTPDDPEALPRPELREQQHSFIIDLSKGGAQLALPVFDAWPVDSEQEFPTEIRADLQPDYLKETLVNAYRAGDHVNAEFSLPTSLSGGADYKTMGEVRWVQSKDEWFFVSLRFISPNAEMTETIERIVEQRETFFSQKISSPREA